MATMNRPSGSRELMMNYGKFKVIRKSGKISKNQRKSGEIRRNQEKSGKIRKNQEKSGKIRKNQEKSEKIRENQGKSGKIRKNQEKNQESSGKIRNHQEKSGNVRKNQKMSATLHCFSFDSQFNNTDTQRVQTQNSARTRRETSSIAFPSCQTEMKNTTEFRGSAHVV